jgi:hypothetical protein
MKYEKNLTDILRLAHYNNDLDIFQNYVDKALEKDLPYGQMLCYVKSHYVNYLLNKKYKNEKNKI